MIDPLAEPSRIALIGDCHGNLDFGQRALSYAVEERAADVVIQLGDFGFWGLTELFPRLMAAAARQLGVPLLFVDGNHEHHEFLNQVPIDPETGLRPLTEGLWHLPRGFRWTWGGVRFVALGGAHSVDRPSRTPGLDWFPEERLTPAQAALACAGGPVDVILAHDSPTGVAIPGLRPHLFHAAEIRSSNHHEDLLRAVADELRPRWYFHGHHHVDYVDELRAPHYRCTVRGLADHRGPLSRSVHVQPLRHLAVHPLTHDTAPSVARGGGVVSGELSAVGCRRTPRNTCRA